MDGSSKQFDPSVEYYPPSLLRKHIVSSEDSKKESKATSPPTISINWTPDFELFQRRKALLTPLPEENLLPQGWPQQLTGPLVWGQTLDPEEFIVDLEDVDVDEVKAALSHFRGRLNTLLP